MNARLRVLNGAGTVRYVSDKSCSGLDFCATTDSVGVTHGDSVSIQCNGVRADRVGPENQASVSCGVEMTIYQSSARAPARGGRDRTAGAG
ncbi:MAG TPA: hypothetical protein VD931_20350 [Baekduia sp.]|nr:hypothetical protein [Baekduia sp.]